MKRYILGAGADRDLNDIWDYIAEDSVEAADRWAGKLSDALDALAERPAIGHTREDLVSYNVLCWAVGAYLIVYRATSLPVEIVAITQGSRDIPAFLGRRLSG